MENNQQLLEELVNGRLDDAMHVCDEARKTQAFDEAMAAIDRLNEMKKTNSGIKNKKEKRWDMVFKGLEVAAVPAILKIVELGCNKYLIKYIGTIEQMETFTGTPGRAIGKMFKF